VLAAALALTACGEDEAPPASASTQPTATQEDQRAAARTEDPSGSVDRDELFALMRAQGLRLQRVRGTDVPLRTIDPQPDGRTRYAEKSGSTFEVLSFLTPADAARAAASVKAAPSVDEILVAQNLVVAFPAGAKEELREEVRRVVTALG
jgi:hypothetical protein